MKKMLKNNTCCFVSALFAGAFFLFVCFHFEAFPFGSEYSLFKIDLVHQYAPILNQFYDLVKEGKSITYSWSSGLGYSYIGNFLNYAASPFNLIIFFFDRHDIPDAISIIILLKSMVTAGAFSYFLRKTFERKDALNVSMSLLYVFSGWYVAYNWNIMWLDALFCLPLVTLGLQKIFNEKKPLLYIVTLTYALMTNYYTAYMLCLFLCVYFVYYYVSRNEVGKDLSSGFFKSKLFKSVVAFALSSVCAALLSAVALLPMAMILTKSSAVTDTVSDGIRLFFDPLTFWTQHFSGVTTIFKMNNEYDTPNVWCGMLTVLLLPVWFFSKKISKKERICDFCLFAFMVLSLGVNVICFVWSGFHFPNGSGDRISFIYIFAAVFITFKAVDRIKDIKPVAAVISAASAAAFIVLMYFLPFVKVEKYMLIISIGFTAVWLAVYFVSRIEKVDKSLLKGVVLFFVCVELIFSQMENFDFNYYRDDYDGGSEQVANTVEKIKQQDSELFFRTETAIPRAYILPMIAGYEGISDFSSVTNYAVALNQCTLGLAGNKENYFTYASQTPVYNSLFDLKYVLDEGHRLENNPDYEFLFENEGYSVYKNKYYLPLGFCVDGKTAVFNTEKYENPFFAQNYMFSAMSGADDLFNYIEPESVKTDNLSLVNEVENKPTHTMCYSAVLSDDTKDGFVTFAYTLPEDGEYYFICDYRPAGDGAEITAAGEPVNIRSKLSNLLYESNGIQPLGEMKKGETVTIKVPVNKKRQGEKINVCLASFNRENFVEGYNRLSRNTLNLTEFENTHFKGTVTADKDCWLFTSVPFDKGWKITVDGKLSDEVIAVDDAYISVPLTAGEHTVEFSFFPRGLKAGACISAATLTGLVAFLIIEKKRKKS